MQALDPARCTLGLQLTNSGNHLAQLEIDIDYHMDTTALGAYTGSGSTDDAANFVRVRIDGEQDRRYPSA